MVAGQTERRAAVALLSWGHSCSDRKEGPPPSESPATDGCATTVVPTAAHGAKLPGAGFKRIEEKINKNGVSSIFSKHWKFSFPLLKPEVEGF